MDRPRFIAYYGTLIIGMGAVLALVEGLPIVGAVLAVTCVAIPALARSE